MTLSKIYLYGPPAAGKSTLGNLLAHQFDLPFYDLDGEITRSAGRSIPEIFSSEGETGFRRRETEVLQCLAQKPQGVVALGGGSLLDPQNRSLVEADGTILLLTAPADVLAQRAQSNTQRPLLNGAQGRLDELLASRARHYGSFPCSFDTSLLTSRQCVREVQKRLGRFRLQGMSGMQQGYDVCIHPGGVDRLGDILRSRSVQEPLLLVSDTITGPLHGERAAAALRASGYEVAVEYIPAGEAHKTIATVAGLWDVFLKTGMDRSGTVIALGGGVVTDLAGFAAATFLRGVHWMALPTTLLAMADASLGGKTGADLPQGKNLVGAFYPPGLVLADPLALLTLPLTELRCGLAEVVKHGVIGDPHLFHRCADLPDPFSPETIRTVFPDVVRQAMALKVDFIEEDPYERGMRAALNLGHTIGHALEAASHYSLRHGEAVAIGLVVEAHLAEDAGLAQRGLAQEIEDALRHLGLPVTVPPALERGDILQHTRFDKKRSAGKVRFALPAEIGRVVTGVEVNEERIQHALDICSART